MTQQEFLNKYGIKATFEEMSKATGYLKFAGEALIPDTGKSAELMMYKQGLNFMFTKFIDSQTKLDGFRRCGSSTSRNLPMILRTL